MKEITVYTDGACSGNPGPGGWACVLMYGEHIREYSGYDPETTNNRMELTAVIEAFQALKRDGLEIRVFTDSSYVANCFLQKWYVGWQRNGWMTSQKKPVENRELWERLLDLVGHHRVRFYRVKGHVNLDHPSTNVDAHYRKFCKNNGDFTMEEFRHVTEMNNRADALANEGIDENR